VSENVGIFKSASLANSITGSNSAEKRAIIFFMVFDLLNKNLTKVANIVTIKITTKKK